MVEISWEISVTVQPGWFCNLYNYQGMSIPGASSRLPAHPSIQPLSTYILAPPHAGKQKIGACFRPSEWCCIKTVKNGKDANGKSGPRIIMLYQNSPIWKWCQRYFANSLYPERMPLGFITFSSPDEPVTLSPVTFALRHLSKNAVFDAKPPFSEAVTLSPPKLFFVNCPVVPPRSQILNVTASNISLSVK